ncbi:MAG: heme biosynthesis protein HemY [Roseovarius sp.]|nr:heme biosynthesis protein HemY [Roseovarius sp.]
MLLSIFKIVLFVTVVAITSFGAIYLIKLDGSVLVTIADREFRLFTPVIVIALFILVFAIWIFFKLTSLFVAVLYFINGDETSISRYFSRNRERKGYSALSDSIAALASGEGDLALSLAAKAERQLHNPTLTSLVTAQAAEMAGDTGKAREVYKRLLENENTRFAGIRGLVRQKLAEGDTDVALKLAKTAFDIKPRHTEMQNTLLKLQAETGDWLGARETLNVKLKYGNLPRDVHRRRSAVLALCDALENQKKDIEGTHAYDVALESNRLSPDLIPAATIAARGCIKAGSKRQAARIIQKAWKSQPHPDLASAYAEIEPDENPHERIKRFSALLKIHPDNRESMLTRAELQIAADDFPAARRTIGNVLESEPDVRVLTIMAAIERGEGSKEEVVKGWLAKAIYASRGPLWICGNCQHIHADWAPVCANCKSFDTLAWQTPPPDATPNRTGEEMHPLIIGGVGIGDVEEKIVEEKINDDVASDTGNESRGESVKAPDWR